MRNAMEDAGLAEPEFYPNGFFTAIFRRSPEYAMKGRAAGSEKPGKKTGVKTREKPRVKTGEKILDLIRANPGITTVEMAEEIGLTAKGIQWNISELKKKGRLRRIGPPRGGHWDVVE